ncbi:hypothetical protein LXL04_004194 [Taraxacum kok-saghyz]
MINNYNLVAYIAKDVFADMPNQDIVDMNTLTKILGSVPGYDDCGNVLGHMVTCLVDMDLLEVDDYQKTRGIKKCTSSLPTSKQKTLPMLEQNTHSLKPKNTAITESTEVHHAVKVGMSRKTGYLELELVGTGSEIGTGMIGPVPIPKPLELVDKS